MREDAVSGTTLADIDDGSYVSRLESDLALGGEYDLFICQLSTNDSWRGIPLGAPVGEGGEYDTGTVCGAIEHIIMRVRRQWGCPIAFYTGTRYDSPEYAAMVEALLTIARLHDIVVLDLWNDADMLAVSPDDYARYMNDPVHPTDEGYRKWWTPKFLRLTEDILGAGE